MTPNKTIATALTIGLGLLTLGACQENTPESDLIKIVDRLESKKSTVIEKPSKIMNEVVLADFNDGLLPNFVKTSNAEVKLVNFKTRKETGGNGLEVTLKSQKNWRASLNFIPNKPWNWSEYSDFHIAFDVASNGQESTQIDLIMVDHSGNAYTRVFVVPVGGASTVYAKMGGHDQTHTDGTPINEFNFVSGLRSNPPTWESNDRQVYSLWGKKSLDLTGITEIRFQVSGNLTDRTFIIDNIRLRPNPKMNVDFLVDIVDQFGQPNKKFTPLRFLLTQNYADWRTKKSRDLWARP